MSKKKCVVVIIISLVLIILLISIIIIRKNISEKEHFDKSFNLSNIDENIADVNHSSTSSIIMEKYKSTNQNNAEDKKNTQSESISTLNSNVFFEGIQGEMIYIRNNTTNANVFQYKQKIDSIKKLDDAIKEFNEACMKHLKISNDTKSHSKVIYNVNNTKNLDDNITMNEGIYKYGLQYCLTYIVKNEEFNINYYMKDGNLICEFVTVL